MVLGFRGLDKERVGTNVIPLQKLRVLRRRRSPHIELVQALFPLQTHHYHAVPQQFILPQN
jgi:hypothetical protein